MRGLDGAVGAVGFQLGSSRLACSADMMLFDEGQPSEKVSRNRNRQTDGHGGTIFNLPCLSLTPFKVVSSSAVAAVLR